MEQLAQQSRPRMVFAAACELHGGYPGDALSRPSSGDLAVCMRCGALGIFNDGKQTREGRILPEPVELEQISPPLDGSQQFMLVQILDAIKNRRAAREAH